MRIGFIGLVALPNTATAQGLMNACAAREEASMPTIPRSFRPWKC